VAKEKVRDITIIGQRAPRGNTDYRNSCRWKKKNRRRQPVAHLIVTNLSGDEAKRIIIRAIEKAGGRLEKAES
jgi:hypothetical protein